MKTWQPATVRAPSKSKRKSIFSSYVNRRSVLEHGTVFLLCHERQSTIVCIKFVMQRDTFFPYQDYQRTMLLFILCQPFLTRRVREPIHCTIALALSTVLLSKFLCLEVLWTLGSIGIAKDLMLFLFRRLSTVHIAFCTCLRHVSVLLIIQSPFIRVQWRFNLQTVRCRGLSSFSEMTRTHFQTIY